ncbi:MAG: DUF1284 domain-containing protein [Ruminococcus sp.]|nr:DUF1284 domain-containing protein [Ruminococcus sp.]MDY3894880.1 DUF1284 domain-containing protein [Candidatus Fimenecus sp.]
MSKFLIRPHHLLCMRYFKGYGYSAEFSENMRYVISNLKNDSEVVLTGGCDDICRKCPNNSKNMCCDGEKVKSYDSSVISLCNLDFDKVYEYGCLYSLVENNIIKKDMLRFVCGDCQWYHICGKAQV